jgi:low temperature requirement protein LtrA
MTAPSHEKPAGVSSIELFFDLVFVFVITQITQLVEHAHGTGERKPRSLRSRRWRSPSS